jgi:serine/threonine protein phosphatase PrpC
LLPKDIHYNTEIQSALSILRSDENIDNHTNDENIDNTNDNDENTDPSIIKQRKIQESKSSAALGALDDLKSMGVWNEHGVTLTLIGYKGGKMEEQINQDRSFVLSPYTIWETPTKTNTNNNDTKKNDNNDKHDKNGVIKNQNNVPSQMMGVMDGHGTKGEIVSEYGIHEVYKRLSKLLQTRLLIAAEAEQPKGEKEDVEKDVERTSTTTTTMTEEETNEIIRDSLSQVFLSINATIPTNGQGGCTASIAFRYANHVHFANVGDSRVFLVTYHPPTQRVAIVHSTQEHKPHLQYEKERILKMGGNVHEPTQEEMDRGASSRLVTPYFSLAMSRSLGDWQASPYGNIAVPDVESISLDEVLDDSVRDLCGTDMEKEEEGQDETCPARESIRVFVVAATDGLLDFVTPMDLATNVAHSLYPPTEMIEEEEEESNDDSSSTSGSSSTSQIHCTTACEQLILKAAEGWYKDMGYDYRDDIAIAAMKIL